MDGFSILDPLAWRPDCVKLHPAYEAGNAAAWLSKTGAAVGVNHYLSGRLYVSKSGWLLLSVPNALVRGVFDAMTATGAELPTMKAFKGESADGELLNAHITVMTGDEVEKIGKDKINERGHHFHYALGPVREFSPKTESLSRVWAIQVASPELSALRKSYGLSALPNDDHPFHITVAVRRKNVLGPNEVAKIDGTRGELKAAATETRWINYQAVGQRPHGKDMTYHLRQNLEHALYAHVLTDKDNKRVAEIVLHALPDAAPNGVGTLFGVNGFHTYPEYRRKGYGRALWNEVASIHPNSLFLARPDNYKDAELSNEQLEQVYQRLGFATKHHLLPDLMPGVYVRGGNNVLSQPEAARPSAKAAATQIKDVLPGGKGDNKPDKDFSPEALNEGSAHEREHTDNPQIAKEIAKDHLSEDPAYYEKVKAIEKGGSVYMNQALNMLNPTAITQPIAYDHNKPVFANIHDQLSQLKQRGDFLLQADRNHRIWRSQLDPEYRYQLAMQAFHGQLPMPSYTDQLIERYGDQALARLGGQIWR